MHAKPGLVHRDVKPLNIIFSERDKRLKLIDLGACADLRSGTNFAPEESILDPLYCPPEQVRFWSWSPLAPVGWLVLLLRLVHLPLAPLRALPFPPLLPNL